ncbi:D-arabinose 1-dehydrogenase [Paramyrothecium foliicola]|nr:D-arabinose 1-dehydrogenase [Paramyrothecium foliicola]
MTASKTKTPISRCIPPIVLGAAAFSQQFVPDPSKMPYVEIVRRALDRNINAFDTSPYYGPSEILLGDALRTISPDRQSYFLITKVGRVASTEFDYSAAWVRYSVCRSLERLNTPYLDLVYTHDAEFVSPEEVLTAVKELRRLRDEGLIRFVGICGYPVDVLASLAEMILRETGEPLDAVQTYGHCCVQNAKMTQPEVLRRFRDARVECITSASPLNMGLLTSRGANTGPQANWHPAPVELRTACHNLSQIAQDAGERTEEAMIRWALETWGRAGAEFGSTAYAAAAGREDQSTLQPIGISVMGVCTADELEAASRLWQGVVKASLTPDNDATEKTSKLDALVRGKMWPSLGEWKDFSWDSPPAGFVNTNESIGVVPRDETAARWGLLKDVEA